MAEVMNIYPSTILFRLILFCAVFCCCDGSLLPPSLSDDLNNTREFINDLAKKVYESANKLAELQQGFEQLEEKNLALEQKMANVELNAEKYKEPEFATVPPPRFDEWRDQTIGQILIFLLVFATLFFYFAIFVIKKINFFRKLAPKKSKSKERKCKRCRANQKIFSRENCR